MTDTALLLVDIQNDYFEDGRWPLHKMDQASDNAARVLEHARRERFMVVHIHHEIPSDDAPFFRPGTKGAEINPKVAPAGGEEVILKFSRPPPAGHAGVTRNFAPDCDRRHESNVH